jgi:cob(I)alamin adenosyltransferase
VSKETTLSELITTLDILSDKLQSPVLLEASIRLDQVSDALINLQNALFYVRAYISVDPTGEGERRRQELIDDSEAIINLIRNGGRYQ